MTTKRETTGQEVARGVGAGKPVALETVDFSDPNRPKTCLEVDFPIVSINQIAAIEGKGSGALKPIYQVSKWWARRRSTVFRALLLSSVTRAPEDPSSAAKMVWDHYYANHQKKSAFKHLKVADIFMGGGTTLVEGSRLGMQMQGNDLNPVAWFVVKQELADVNSDEVRRLLAEVEAEVKPQILPFYYCDGPNGEKGAWTHKPSGRVMGSDFDPLSLTPEKRKEYSYEGPEIIYTFWAKHGPCHVTGCGHRTPIMTNPVMAVKSLSVKHWQHECSSCGIAFDIEDTEARMAPDVPLFVAPDQKPYSTLDVKGRVACPSCGYTSMVKLGKGINKKVELSLLVHPDWLAGSPKHDEIGYLLGGSPHDDAASTSLWGAERSSTLRLLEVRGVLPLEVTCPETGVTFKTSAEGGTVPKRSHFQCASCGAVQDVLEATRLSGKAAPYAGYGVQGYSPVGDANGRPFSGRFFAPFDPQITKQFGAAADEWETRKNTDLANFWPRSAIPIGAEIGPHDVDGHRYTHWWTMFNSRQLLTHSLLLKSIIEIEGYSWSTREYLLSAFQQYLRNQNMFCFWNTQRALEPLFSDNHFHPKLSAIENSCFSGMGRGDFISCARKSLEALDWVNNPWEIACEADGSHSEKLHIGDQVISGVTITCNSSTELSHHEDASIDVVVTDPPFGDLVQYAELSDFFYVWLRLALKDQYPEIFSAQYTPKTLEAVANKFRDNEDPNGYYKRLLTACWSEAHRILKKGGLLVFTFHHSEDAPWVAVLESLFDAGFYLEATYPIRSDETKGDGQFGSKKVEYDIIHVCRKRTVAPEPVSWGRMRREVLADVRQLQGLLENHARAGLPAADLQVIRRGKALEYFSRHYGKVYVDESRPISVKDALIGINQLIDEDTQKTTEPPPVSAEPITRQFLRIFDGKTELARDQMQKLLRGSGIAPDEFINRGWTCEERKVFYLVDPLSFARDWQGKHRRRLSADLDQALVMIGACYDGSGINASETLKNENFKPHPALRSLLEWLSKRGQTLPMRNAASRALTIFNNWADSHKEQVHQLSLFLEDAL
jgi:hypothetical protein